MKYGNIRTHNATGKKVIFFKGTLNETYRMIKLVCGKKNNEERSCVMTLSILDKLANCVAFDVPNGTF